MIGGPTPAIAFIIPVRNAERHLGRCLSSIVKATAAFRAELIVVDDGSTDRSAAIAEAMGAAVLPSPEAGPAAARNAGVAGSRAPVLAFVDADHEIVSGWVAAAIAVLDDSTVAATGALCDAPSPGTWVQRAYDALRGRHRRRQEVSWLGAGNLAVRAAAFRSIGGFDEALTACEDVDLCQRLRMAGGRIVSEPLMGSVHFGDPATLAALFRGELWRGRNSLRVSLRSGGMAALAGIALPLAVGMLLVATVVLAAATPWVGAGPSLLSSALLVTAFLPRTLLMCSRSPSVSPVRWVQYLVVAGTYEVARAASLVVRADHQTRTRVAESHA
jgi:cellulose synthase/poly-beta-1,6-N-acetylglucosamine synthase-like glycosyltransferase